MARIAPSCLRFRYKDQGRDELLVVGWSLEHHKLIVNFGSRTTGRRYYRWSGFHGWANMSEDDEGWLNLHVSFNCRGDTHRLTNLKFVQSPCVNSRHIFGAHNKGRYIHLEFVAWSRPRPWHFQLAVMDTPDTDGFALVEFDSDFTLV